MGKNDNKNKNNNNNNKNNNNNNKNKPPGIKKLVKNAWKQTTKLDHTQSNIKKDYKKEIDNLNKQITQSTNRIKELTTQIQTLNDMNTEQSAKILSLKLELEQETARYNDALIQIENLYSAERMAQFNQSVSETQTLIEDLNQPYVKHGDDLVAMLSKYIPVTNADATYEKIEYREIEFSKLKNINNIINIIYYLGVIFLFVLLFTSNNVFLSDRYPFYIFLILLPFLYPWIYMYTIKIWNYLFPVQEYSGPVNAFVDQSKQPSVYYN